jgi:hypothetical protein
MFNIFSKLLSSSQRPPQETKTDQRATLFPLTQIVRNLTFTDNASSISAISQLLGLVQEPENAIIVCQDPEMDILHAIKVIFQDLISFRSLFKVDDWILDHLTIILSWLALPQSNAIRICSKELDFLPVLFEMNNREDLGSPSVSQLVWQTVRNEIHVILGNCSVYVETHDYLFSPEFAYFDLCKDHLFANPDAPGEVSRFCSLTMNIADSSHMLTLVNMGIPDFFVKKLIIYGSQRGSWTTNHFNMIDRCFCILLNFSLHPPCCPALRNLIESPNIGAFALFSYFIREYSADSIQALKSVMLLANVYCGVDSDPPINHFYLKCLSALPGLLTIYAATLEYDESKVFVKDLKAKGFMFGRLSVKHITASLKNFAIISGEKKQLLLCKGPLLFLVYQTIQLFLTNAEECKGMIVSTTGVKRSSTAGGGGKDYESLENVLELLLQLALYIFCEEKCSKEEVLQELSCRSSTFTLVSLLEQLIALPEHRTLSNKAKQYVILLLNQLK